VSRLLVGALREREQPTYLEIAPLAVVEHLEHLLTEHLLPVEQVLNRGAARELARDGRHARGVVVEDALAAGDETHGLDDGQGVLLRKARQLVLRRVPSASSNKHNERQSSRTHSGRRWRDE